ncbi:MAG TPA: anhydro-N-acetylmuramic acid kinase [Candidatus Hydrogenedentes bacterium]|jgi:anhydro-N-acetylmuramic acid kinase|nr:anhydro-N-acetylmuramic acid kinase [Candidatus Hydrogenedentota bacterium]
MKRIAALQDKLVRYAIGLTADSACLGVDAALVRLKGSGPQMLIKVVKDSHFRHPPGLQNRLLAARRSARDLAVLSFELGREMADVALGLQEWALSENLEVDFIATPGYTVAHIPTRGAESASGHLSIGDPNAIAAQTGLPVVSDFASADMAVGGQGNVLHPYTDWVLFNRPDRVTACLHLGGYASLTIVTPEMGDVVAFDVGPCLASIDSSVRLLTHATQTRDRDGAIASKGLVIDEFLEYLLSHPYFSRVPPKSTSQDEFGPEEYLRDALNGRRDHSLEDMIATVTMAVGYSITRAFSRFVYPNHSISRLILSGEGLHNRTLMRNVKTGIKEVALRKTDRYGIPCNAMDPLSASILGSEAIFGNPANIPSATGAKRRVLSGRITLP